MINLSVNRTGRTAGMTNINPDMNDRTVFMMNRDANMTGELPT